MAILGVFLLLVFGSHRFVERQLAGFEIMTFLPDNATEKDAEKVRDAIAALPLTKKVEVLSREKEWAELKRKLNTQIDLEGVTDNPIPYTVSVESKDSRRTAALAEQIRKLDGVDSVSDSREDYRLVKAIADLVRLVGFAAAVVLCFTTVFIVSNAIRLTMYARRHEIRIMQLVGATNWFIRVPLVLEGLVLGAIGAAIAMGLITLGSDYVASIVQRMFPPTLRDMSSGIARIQFMWLLVTGGAAIGALGSFISIRRFLKI
jgi:cell division transport system permease protein